MKQSRNTYAAELLFAQARAHVNEILFLAERYNEIAEALRSMGYEMDVDSEGGSWPMPTISIEANGCERVSGSDFLDDFWKSGPVSKKNVSPIRRPLTRVRERLGSECGWKCFYCAKAGDENLGPDGRVWHVDHAYPVSRGGDDLPDNLVLACATCNLDKRASTAAEYFKRLATVRSA